MIRDGKHWVSSERHEEKLQELQKELEQQQSQHSKYMDICEKLSASNEQLKKRNAELDKEIKEIKGFERWANKLQEMSEEEKHDFINGKFESEAKDSE
jgi:short-subunit dehydrogenase